MTYDQFKLAISQQFKTAEWQFRDFSPEGKVYYRWDDQVHSSASWDPDEGWYVSPGRGTSGRGETLAEALEREDQEYSQFMASR